MIQFLGGGGGGAPRAWKIGLYSMSETHVLSKKVKRIIALNQLSRRCAYHKKGAL